MNAIGKKALLQALLVANKMKKIYLLQHRHPFEDGSEDTKFLGIFATKKEVMQAIKFYKKLLGFKDFPNEFFIDKYEIDRCEWDSGFIVENDMPFWSKENSNKKIKDLMEILKEKERENLKTGPSSEYYLFKKLWQQSKPCI